MSQNDKIEINVDSKPFAELTILGCNDTVCIGQSLVGAADIATLEGSKSFEIRSRDINISSPIRNFAEARAGRGKTLAEVNAEMQKEMEKSTEEIRERQKAIEEAGFFADAPAARPQQGFCDALKRVMAAVPGDFKSIMGEKSISVPGSGKCELDINKVSSTYSCETKFKLREVADKQMASLAQIVGKCLPSVKAERRVDNDGFPTIDFSNRKSKIDVWITLGKTWGGYDVNLWVDGGL